MGARWGPTASLVRVFRPLEKPDFIELKERLAEGEEHAQELVRLRTEGRRARNSGQAHAAKRAKAAACPEGTRSGDSFRA